MTISLKKKVPILMLSLAMVIITICLIITNRTKKVFDNSAFWTARTHDVIQETQNVLSIIKDIQVGGRDYIITGDSAFLETVNLSQGMAWSAIDKLSMLTLDNPSQSQRIDSVALITGSMINYVARYLRARNEKGFHEAAIILNNGNGKHYLDSLKHLLARVQQVEYKLLALRRDANQRNAETLFRIFFFLFASQALLVVIIFFSIRHNILTRNKTQKQLALYESIVLSSEDAIISKDLNGIITSWNHRAQMLFGYSKEEIVGQHISILIPPDRLDEETLIMDRIKENKKIDNYDTVRLMKNSQPVHISLTVSPLKDAAGTIIGASKIARNITQRIMNEDARRKSSKDISDYKHALDASAIVAITDHHGIIKHVNENFCKISKYQAEELIGQDHRIINSGHHSKDFIRDLWAVILGGKIWKGELKNKAKDGTTYWVDTTIVSFLNDEGKPFQYIAIGADITARKHAEAENERNEIRFRSTLDKMLEGVEIIGFDFRYLYVNEAYEKQVRIPRAELVGYTVMEKFPGIEKTRIFEAIQQCFDKRVIIHLEDEFTFSDNIKRWFEISFQPVPEGIFILSVDITDEKQSEEKIRHSEERFRSLIENSYEIVSIIDEQFKPIYRSPASSRITGWTDKDLEGEGSVEQTHPDDMPKLKDTLAKVMHNPGVSFPINFRTKHKSGHYIFMEGIITNMLHNESIKGIVSNFRDVTETHNAEDKIRQSEMRFRSLIENSYDIVSILDETFKPVYRSPSSTRTTGYSNEEREAIGGGTQQTHPDDVETVTKVMKEVLTHPMKPIPLRFRAKHKDGHYVLMDGVITNMLNNESIKGIVSNFRDITENQKAEEKIRESEKIYKTIAGSIPGSVICLLDKDYRYLLIEGDMLESMGYSKEKLLGKKATDVIPANRMAEVQPHFLRVFNGESFTVENFREGFDILSRFVPLRDENNEVFAAMVVIFDVSELKKAQRAVAEANVHLERKIKERTLELEVANKELESFSYSVAHDLRTPLRAINSYASMLEEDYNHLVDAEGKRFISAIKNNATRMGSLIDDLLTFSKLGRKQIQKSLIDMNDVTQASLYDCHLPDDYPGEIIIHKLDPVMADASLMRHVMVNLLSNAIKYTSKKEKPSIEVWSECKSNEIIFTIKDNGVGFDMAFAHKLFGVFQRLHKDNEFDGTGVGLAIVQRVINRHDGKIWADSTLGMGASFYFSLPLNSDIGN